MQENYAGTPQFPNQEAPLADQQFTDAHKLLIREKQVQLSRLELEIQRIQTTLQNAYTKAQAVDAAFSQIMADIFKQLAVKESDVFVNAETLTLHKRPPQPLTPEEKHAAQLRADAAQGVAAAEHPFGGR